MSTTPPIHTDRLCLVPGTAEIGRAEIDDRSLFAALLDATVPKEWPPPLNDEGSMRFFTEYVENNPDAGGWLVWYVLLKDPGAGLTAVGTSGFKGTPDQSGAVEIGYSVLEAYQRRGIATKAVGALIEWAFSHERVTCVVAQTFPDLHASIRVLEIQGFSFLGGGTEKGAIMYRLSRADRNRQRGIARTTGHP